MKRRLTFKERIFIVLNFAVIAWGLILLATTEF